MKHYKHITDGNVEIYASHSIMISSQAYDNSSKHIKIYYDPTCRRKIAIIDEIVYISEKNPTPVDSSCYLSKHYWTKFYAPHRLDGPALVVKKSLYNCFGRDGKNYACCWFIEGRQHSKQSFWDAIKDTKYSTKVFAEIFGQKY